jgi:hypothetical protein
LVSNTTCTVIVAPEVPSKGLIALGVVATAPFARLSCRVTVPAVVGAVHNRATGVAEVIPVKATAVAPVENVVTTPEFDPYAVAVATVPAAEFVPGVAETATVVAALA